MPIAIKINPKDNVVVALHPIAKGTAVPVDNTTVTAIEDIPQGHKMAIAPIKSGENVIKYGFPIGHATADAVPGTWMHTHNIHTNLSGEIEYSYHPNVHPLTPAAPDTFMGYRRKDGRAAIRNEIWIIPTVGCVNDCAKALVRDNQDLVTGSIDGLYTFTHPFGCSQTGHDHAQTRKLLASLVRHPNAGAVLVLSLGCENLTHEQFLAELGDYDHDRVKFLTCQDVEDELVAGRDVRQAVGRSGNREVVDDHFAPVVVEIDGDRSVVSSVDACRVVGVVIGEVAVAQRRVGAVALLDVVAQVASGNRVAREIALRTSPVGDPFDAFELRKGLFEIGRLLRPAARAEQRKHE